MVRFANIVLESAFGLFFVLFVGGIVGVVVMILGTPKYGEVTGLALFVIPIIFLVVVGVPLRLISRWAERIFIAKFRLLPRSRNEKEILKKLKEIALWLEEEFEKADETLDKEAAEWRIRRAKNRFWSMWRLAKALDFPVFKSWKAHARIKF